MKDNIGYRKPHQRRGEATPQKMREMTPPVVGWTAGPRVYPVQKAAGEKKVPGWNK